MSDSRHEAMFEWLGQCPAIADLFVNFAEGTPQSTSYLTGNGVIRRFLDGSSVRAYDFYIARFEETNADVPNDPQNAEILASVESIADWITTQNRQHNFPQFPNGEAVQSVSVLSETPSVAGSDRNTAKYLISCRVIYRKGA